MSPADELRAAARLERVEWDSETCRKLAPNETTIHLAVAGLPDVAAKEWDDDIAALFGESNMRWYSALTLARAINTASIEVTS